MRLVQVLAALAAATFAAAAPPSPTGAALIAAARARISLAFNFSSSGSYGNACLGCPDGESIGALLRLVFHDAVGGGGPRGSGGVNGCVDSLAPDNAGLAAVQAKLDAARAPFLDSISRGDFFVLAATVAVEYASSLAPNASAAQLASLGLRSDVSPLALPFRLGRVDDRACAGIDEPFLAKVDFSWLGLLDLFGTRFSMSNEEIVAIMGGHSVGKLHINNSGIEGAWTATQSSFSTSYFQSLLAGSFARNGTSDVWRQSATPVDERLVMLRPDLELVVLTSPESDAVPAVSAGTTTSCMAFAGLAALPGSTCPAQARTIATVQRFAASTAEFFAVFATAWAKMTEMGYSPNPRDGGATLVPAAAARGGREVGPRIG